MATVMKPYPLLDWAGRNVTGDMARYVKSLSFTDVLEDGEAGRDTMSLVLDNRDRIFMKAWKPTEGDVLKPGIGWTVNGKTRVWQWGRFVIDGVKFRLAPDEVIITASAQPADKAALENVKTRSWDNIKLHALMQQIAREAGCEAFIYDVKDKTLAHVEQRAESARALLKRIADEQNVPINFKNADLYVGTPATLEPLVIDIEKRGELTGADLPESKRNTYSAVSVEYYDTNKAETIRYIAGDPNATQERTLKLYNIPVSSVEEARDYANQQLSSGGSKQTNYGSLSLTGKPISAGQEVTLINVGDVHAKWKIASQTTSLRRGQWSATARIARI